MADLSQDDFIVAEISSNNTPAVIGGDDRLTISPDLTDANGDGIMEPSGTLTISDPDAGDAAFISGPIQGQYGLFFIQESGFWSYASDTQQPAILALGPNDSVTEVITVTTVDGTTHDVIFTIYGENDTPSDIDLSNLKVVEGVDGAIIGDLSVTDNQGDYHSYTVSDNRFEVVNGQLKLKAGNTFDRNISPETEITITATDQHGASYSENFTLTTFSPFEEQLVNTYTSFNQFRSSVAVYEDGSKVIVWRSYHQDGDGEGVYGQRYGVDGQPVGHEFQIDDTVAGDQDHATVEYLQNGNFVIAWYGEDASGKPALYHQHYTKDGEKIGGKITIDGYALPANQYNELNYQPVDVEALSDGGYAVTWFDDNYIRAAIYNGDGSLRATLAPEHRGQYGFASPSAVELEGGQILFVWQSYGSGNARHNVLAELYNADGTSTGIRINLSQDVNALHEHSPAVAALPGGGFVASWVDSVNGGGTAQKDLQVRFFDANGQAISQNIEIAQDVKWLATSQIVALPDGTIAVFWEQDDTDGSGRNIYAQRLDQTGAKIGEAFIVSDKSDGYQHRADVAVNPDGTVTVVWDSNEASSVGYDIKSKIIDFNTPAIIGGDDRLTISPDLTDANGDGIMEPSGTLTISDPDAGDAAFISGPIQGEYGLFFIQESGFWSYAADAQQPAILALGPNDSLTEVITVTTVDGTTHDVTFTIYGEEETVNVSALSTEPVSSIESEESLLLEVTESVSLKDDSDYSQFDEMGMFDNVTLSDEYISV